MNTSLFFTAVLLTSTLSWADCLSQTGFQVVEPIYVGEHSLWSTLEILSQSAPSLKPTDADVRRAGLCILNIAKQPRPSEAVTAMAPAMLIKEGDKLFVLFNKNYSLNLPPWAYDEKACLQQISTLSERADEYLAAPNQKVSFGYKNDIYTVDVSTNVSPIQYKATKSATNYIVQKDDAEICVFSASSK